jgi:hypothetical protein
MDDHHAVGFVSTHRLGALATDKRNNNVMSKKTRVVNKKKEPWDVYIGRGSAFGNRYIIGKDGTRKEVIAKYRKWFVKMLRKDRFHRAVMKLKGKRLGCFCKPKACHGDVIVEYLEGTSGGG